MRAARIHDWKGVPVVEDLPLPERRSQQTLVRIDAATISHLDLTVRTGEFPLGPSLPYVPGCEGAGTVVESDTLAAGTQVIFRAHAVGLECDGTWREYAVVPDEALLPVATPVDPAVAATFLTPTTTAAVALFTIGRLEAGQTVLVSGATGAVGSMAVQLARAAGANVLALVSRSSRLRDLPAGVQGISLADADATAKLAETRPADLLIDTIGGAGLSQRIGWVARGGKVACLGYTAGTEFTIDLPSWFFSTVSILPVNLMANEAEAHRFAAELLPRFADGGLTIAVQEFELEQVADALDRLSQGRVNGRAVLRFRPAAETATAVNA